jgi:hypothetical protein
MSVRPGPAGSTSGGTRVRRLLILVAPAVLAVGGTAACTTTSSAGAQESARASASANHASGSCTDGQVRISTRLPSPNEIKIKVFTGLGTVPDLANQVATEFKKRGFVVDAVEDHAERFDHVAKLRYGPKGVAAASVVRAHFLDKPDTGGFDLNDSSDTVDVTLGSAFIQLGTKTEVNQKMAQLGPPSPPPGTCDSGE